MLRDESCRIAYGSQYYVDRPEYIFHTIYTVPNVNFNITIINTTNIWRSELHNMVYSLIYQTSWKVYYTVGVFARHVSVKHICYVP